MRDALLADRLRTTAIFAGLDDHDLVELAKAGVRRSLKKRQRLYARGESGDALVLVVAGRLDIARGDVVMRSLGAGALFGMSTVAGVTHSADVTASERSEIFLVGGKFVRALFARRPEIALRMVAELARLVSELSDDVEALRADDVLARTRKKILQLAKGRREVSITHAELAKLVGATRANTSRALKTLESEGLLARRRGRIELGT